MDLILKTWKKFVEMKLINGLLNLGSRLAVGQAEELATETITQMGQGAIDAEMGYRDQAPNVIESFEEIAPVTIIQTAMMQALGVSLHSMASRFTNNNDVQKDNTDNTNIKWNSSSNTIKNEENNVLFGALRSGDTLDLSIAEQRYQSLTQLSEEIRQTERDRVLSRLKNALNEYKYQQKQLEQNQNNVQSLVNVWD